ncbi:hypothetical protein GQ53DRAFT_628915, partial [Thozetella sp. PMI_491]
VQRLPNIALAELYDKSKSDLCGKAIFAGQITWVCVNVFVRVAKVLSISQLEISTAAFSASAAVTYALLINKPQHVSV